MWRKIVEFFQNIGSSGKPLIKVTKRVSITTTDKTGERHHYGSLEEVPPELRAEIEKTTSEALREGLDASSSEKQTASFISMGMNTRKFTRFAVKDALGNQRVYHSLDEMPPDVRATFEQLQKGTNE